MNRTQFVTAIARRCGIATTDPRYASIPDTVNEAIHEWELSVPNGWDFLVRHVTIPTVAGQAAYDFDTIGVAITDDDQLPAAIVTKIVEVDYLTSTFRGPLERFSFADLRHFYGELADVSQPANYAVEAEQLWIFPTPQAVYDLDLRVVIGEPDLAAAGDSPLTPVRFHGTIVALAECLTFEEMGEDVRATQRRATYERRRLQALASSRPYRGAGMVRRFSDA